MSRLGVPHPRLLPMTILTIGLLLGIKSLALVRAALAEAPPASTESGIVPAAQAAPANLPPPPAATAPLPARTQSAPVSDAELALLQNLRARKAELDRRETALSEREAVLSAAERKLAERVDELTGLQTRLQQLEADRKAHDEANWAGLVKLYEAMKPRDAANIFNDLDMTVLLQVLDRMKEIKAAPILAAMRPERARQATQQLAAMRTRENTVPGSSAGNG